MNTLLYHAFVENIGRENVIYAAGTTERVTVLHVDGKQGYSTVIMDKVLGTQIKDKTTLMAIYIYSIRCKTKELVPFNMNQWETCCE